MNYKNDTINYNKIPLHLTIHEIDAHAPSLIFIHGMSMHAGAYAFTIPNANFLAALSAEGFNVIGLDLQGHGHSGGTRGLFTYHELMGNIKCAADYVLERYNDRIGITGSSMGGVLSFYAAIEDRRIKSAVCHNVVDLRDVCPIFYLKRHFLLLPLLKILKPFASLLTWLPLPIVAYIEPKDVFDNKENFQYIVKDPFMTWAYRCSSWISVFYYPDDKPAIELQKAPVRIIDGEQDKIFPVAYTRTFYERLQCQKDFVVVPGTKHMLLLEHINIAVPLITEWFKRAL
jgi:alpha-beta hydrolase superfamily lysophospholipase